ncbi:alpha/beta hydrolase family protein [Nonomuraea dietziae]|uniref:alpha/beta hydrolase family protein n=1 Tax=Nonomuraea dietziae TaxID=65515 RepID=UPI0033C94686
MPTAGGSRWWPRTRRATRTSAGRPSATTPRCGESRCPTAGYGCSNWTPAGRAWWMDLATGTSASPHRHDQLSPISYASRISTPVLILHGEDDTNVPVGQSTYFHRALRRFGVEHEFVVYPREGHAILERNHQLDVLRRTRAWFDRWLSTPAV